VVTTTGKEKAKNKQPGFFYMLRHFTTMLTSFLGTMITFLISLS